jgi:hypothetical protein
LKRKISEGRNPVYATADNKHLRSRVISKALKPFD